MHKQHKADNAFVICILAVFCCGGQLATHQAVQQLCHCCAQCCEVMVSPAAPILSSTSLEPAPHQIEGHVRLVAGNVVPIPNSH